MLVELRNALSKGIRAGDSEAAEAIRELIETVTVFRDHSCPGGVTVEIAGRLNALLGQQAYPNKVRGVWGKITTADFARNDLYVRSGVRFDPIHGLSRGAYLSHKDGGIVVRVVGF